MYDILWNTFVCAQRSKKHPSWFSVKLLEPTRLLILCDLTPVWGNLSSGEMTYIHFFSNQRLTF